MSDRNYKLNLATTALIFLLICLWAWLSSCSVVEKVLHKEKHSEQVQTREKTVSIEKKDSDSASVSQKDIKVVGGITLSFDTGCRDNKLVYNHNTGLLQASGGVRGVSIQHARDERLKDSVRKQESGEAQKNREYVNTHQVDTVTITKEKTVKRVPLMFWIGAGLVILLQGAWHHRKRIFSTVKGYITGV